MMCERAEVERKAGRMLESSLELVDKVQAAWDSNGFRIQGPGPKLPPHQHFPILPVTSLCVWQIRLARALVHDGAYDAAL